MSVLFYCAFAVLIFLLGSFAYAGYRGAPWVPTWGRDIERLVKLLDIAPEETFCEIGCGDGRVVMGVCKHFGVKGIGIELSFAQYIAAQLRKRFTKAQGVEIIWKDAFNVDLSQVDVVYLFLMSETYKKIKKKLEEELKPGARVVTYVWAMPGWEPAIVDKEKNAPVLYIYKR